MESQLTKHHADQEIRSFRIEFRADNESRRVEGYAAIFESRTDMGWYEEEIGRDAFTGADMSGVRALFNHNPDHLLASTTGGTLSLAVDERGLKYSFDMPNTSMGNDMLEMMRRGDLTQSSFAFRVKSQTWTETEGQPDLRTITAIEGVYDVSPVTYPAYEDTDVALRSKQAQQPPTPKPTPDPEPAPGFDPDVRALIIDFPRLLH